VVSDRITVSQDVLNWQYDRVAEAAKPEQRRGYRDRIRGIVYIGPSSPPW
jgi:hypothetical protein